MRIGIVGFAQTGKSTLFQYLTGVEPDQSAVRSGQLGIAEVNDPRLQVLSELYQPKKITPATLELTDTPGLNPKGGSENAQVLGLMRQADALLIVLGQFYGNDPVDELNNLLDELVFADLALLTNRIEKVQSGLKKPRPPKEREEIEKELASLEQLVGLLESGGSTPKLTDEEEKRFRAYQLFIEKPRFIVVNVAEESIGDHTITAGLGSESAASLCASIELELSQLSDEERNEFMSDLGIDQLSRDALLEKLVQGTMGQITFFTCGPTEVRGWPIVNGTTAVNAAGKIHTDLARGFIRAEVVHYDDLIRCGSEKEAKNQGVHRLEGKEYVVKDGDVMLIRFNV